MSKDIFLKTGEFSSMSINRSKSALSDVARIIETIKTELYAAYYDCGATHKRIFSTSTIEDVGKGCNTAHSAQVRLGKIAQYLDNGPERLIAVDRSTRGTYTNIWDRIVNVFSNAVVAVISGVSSLWNNLFGKNKNKTGIIVAINPYGYLADRFDWSETNATKEEIDNVIASARVKAKSGESAEEAVLRELKAFYDERLEYSSNAKALLIDIINNDIGSGPRKYWSWYYGRNSDRTDGWCATFVSYIMAQAGVDLVSPSKEKKWFITHPLSQAEYLKSKNCFHDKSEGYNPKTGDLVYFDNIANGSPIDHVGMIYVGEDGTVYVIHGNWSGKVCMSKLYDDYANKSQKLIDCVAGYGDIQALVNYQSNNED